jgi:hypothetical protein
MTETNWPQADIDYAAGELAREYRTVSLAIIAMVVSIAAKNTDPKEGRVRLLQSARKNLSR